MKKEKLIEAGIDYAGGLERFVGNTGLYEKYLEKFLSDQHFSDAKEAFERKDLKEVLAQVHALKGLAGTLGMQELFSASSELVNALRADQQSGLEPMLERIGREQEKMIQAIQA